MGDREISIVTAYRNGKTLRVVGEEFGIGAERVRQIVLSYDRQQRRISVAEAAVEGGGVRSIPTECLDLSVRARNALRNENFLTLGDIVDGMICLQAAPEILPNFGKTSLAEVKKLLKLHGFESDSPRLSKKAALALSSLNLRTSDDVLEKFGIGGVYEKGGSGMMRLRGVGYKELAELRSIALTL